MVAVPAVNDTVLLGETEPLALAVLTVEAPFTEMVPPPLPVEKVKELFRPMSRTCEPHLTAMSAPRVVIVMLPPAPVELLLTIARSCEESCTLTPAPDVRWLVTVILPPRREP